MTGPKTPEELVKKFQCPGCVCGSDPESCSAYKMTANEGQVQCTGHVPGTSFGFSSAGRFMLGLPRGFDRVGAVDEDIYGSHSPVRIWPKGSTPRWDHLNVPVWALDRASEEGGFRFVRTFLPRINVGFVDVIEDGDADPWPETERYFGEPAFDVAAFAAEID